MRFTFYKMNLSAFSCCVALKRISCNAASLTVADTVNNFFSPYLTKERNLDLQIVSRPFLSYVGQRQFRSEQCNFFSIKL